MNPNCKEPIWQPNNLVWTLFAFLSHRHRSLLPHSRAWCGTLHISLSAFTDFHRKTLAELALKHRVAAISSGPEFPEADGLMSYGATLEDGFRRSAYFVDRILKGASPKDLPAEEPTKFYLVINTKTAAALGITFPDIILVQADKVIE